MAPPHGIIAAGPRERTLWTSDAVRRRELGEPLVFHVMVALTVGLEYKLEAGELPLSSTSAIAPGTRRARQGALPRETAASGSTESSAITEYLSETFAPPAHPPHPAGRIRGSAREHARRCRGCARA